MRFYKVGDSPDPIVGVVGCCIRDPRHLPRGISTFMIFAGILVMLFIILNFSPNIFLI